MARMFMVTSLHCVSVRMGHPAMQAVKPWKLRPFKTCAPHDLEVKGCKQSGWRNVFTADVNRFLKHSTSCFVLARALNGSCCKRSLSCTCTFMTVSKMTMSRSHGMHCTPVSLHPRSTTKGLMHAVHALPGLVPPMTASQILNSATGQEVFVPRGQSWLAPSVA